MAKTTYSEQEKKTLRKSFGTRDWYFPVLIW